MDEIGYMGAQALSGTLYVATIWRNSSEVPTTPTGTPTYAIYSTNFSSSGATGSLDASDQDSKAGLRTASISLGSGAYSSGQLYTFIFQGTVSSAARTQKGTFLVY